MPTVRSSLILGAALLAAANLPLQAQAASRCTSTATSISCSAQTAWIDSGSAGQRKVVFQVPTGSAPSAGWPVALLFHGSLVRVSGFTYASDAPFGGYHQGELVRALLDSGYAVIAPNALTAAEAWQTNDPQYAERENLVEWEDQIFGEMKGIGITNRFKNNPSQIVASAPCFGEHNREVLQEFGYTDKEIDDLYKKGEIVTWTPADTARIRHLPDWGFFWDTERQCERIGMEWPLKDE